MSTPENESEATTFNSLMRQAYRVSPRLFTKLMTSPGYKSVTGRRIYLEIISSPENAITAADLIKRGYKEPTVYRSLKVLNQIGLITSTTVMRGSKAGPRRVFLWRAR